MSMQVNQEPRFLSHRESTVNTVLERQGADCQLILREDGTFFLHVRGEDPTTVVLLSPKSGRVVGQPMVNHVDVDLVPTPGTLAYEKAKAIFQNAQSKFDGTE